MAQPEGVKVVRSNGTEINCELVHLGHDGEGMDIWAVAGVEFHPERGDRIHVDKLPARTTIAIGGGPA